MMTLTDDQRMLTDSVAPFMAEEGAISKQLRHWRDIGCKDGFGHGLWKQFAELGLTGILIPEAQGGAGLGMVEVAVADHDARARRVRITRRGLDAVAQARLVLDACDEECADRVGAERYRVFRDMLAEVALG